MGRKLPSLNGLRAFEAAARHESFTRAADELCVTQGAVSHQVKALEAELGLQLFNRQAQGLSITEAGREYLYVVRDALDSIALGTQRLQQRQNGNVLTVSLSRNLASKWMVHRLGRFADAYPDIDLRISATSHHVDFAREDVDMAIRNSEGELPGLSAVRLCKEELFPVCSPNLLTQGRLLLKPDDLKHHTLLHLDHRQDWSKWLDAAGIEDKSDLQDKGPVFNQAGIILDAAVDGQGVALARTALAAQDLIKGRLVRPFDLALPVSYSYWIVCPKTTQDLKKNVLFREWLLAEAAEDERLLNHLNKKAPV